MFSDSERPIESYRGKRRKQINITMKKAELERFTLLTQAFEIPPSTLAKVWLIQPTELEEGSLAKGRADNKDYVSSLTVQVSKVSPHVLLRLEL